MITNDPKLGLCIVDAIKPKPKAIVWIRQISGGRRALRRASSLRKASLTLTKAV